MKEQQQQLIEYIKSLPNIKGCITGSALLPEYHEGSDVDIFLYNFKAFNLLYYTLKFNPLFTILEPLEIWKAKQFEDVEDKPYQKFGLTTIKFYYNTTIQINIILKKDCNNIFSVLSTFDMNLISKGYCLETKQVLDLSGDSQTTKIVSCNKWNTNYSDNADIWEISRVLRQLNRVFKYSKRGYNCDALVTKYLELIEKIQEHQNIFKSDKFDIKLDMMKENTDIIKNICLVWLETHEISDEQITLLEEKLRIL